MNDRNDKFFGNGVKLEPSWTDKCRDMEKVLKEKIVTINLNHVDDVYIRRMVTAMQSLHELNKHH